MDEQERDVVRVLDAVDRQAAIIDQTLTFVHEHPELAHEEHECAAYLARGLEHGGFTVQTGIAGLETAFLATAVFGAPGPTVGMVTVYDAVPGAHADGTPWPMHACGHGPISAGVVGAALALATIGEHLPGCIVVIGCPADEIHAPGTIRRGGGKELTAEAGVWDDIDVALYAHPEFIDTVSLQSQWLRRDRLTVAGKRSLTDGSGSEPIEALHELVSAVAGLPASKVVLETLMLDGDVEDASHLNLDASVLTIDGTEEDIDDWAERLRTEVPRRQWRLERKIPGIRADKRVTELVARAFADAGRSFEADPPPLPFATDFGAISRRVPAALIGVGREGGWAFHTPAGADQFASEAGRQAAHDLARVLALSCVHVLRAG